MHSVTQTFKYKEDQQLIFIVKTQIQMYKSQQLIILISMGLYIWYGTRFYKYIFVLCLIYDSF